jgi:hypothetical protein
MGDDQARSRARAEAQASLRSLRKLGCAARRRCNNARRAIIIMGGRYKRHALLRQA